MGEHIHWAKGRKQTTYLGMGNGRGCEVAEAPAVVHTQTGHEQLSGRLASETIL